MADIREIVLADQLTTRKFWAPVLATWWPRLKFAVRRFVVLTSVPPVRSLYAAIYRVHIWYAVRMLRRFPGARAIYITPGELGADTVFGVSDIDFFFVGDWNDQEHAEAIRAIRNLTRRSPLYDTASTHQVHAADGLRRLFESDYFFQYRLNLARETWRLAFGEDVLAKLPPAPPDRALGGVYMVTKVWWMMYAVSAFGGGPTAWDPIFRNSVAWKVVAEVLRFRAACQNVALRSSRAEVVRLATENATQPDKTILERLAQSARSRFLRYPGDVSTDAFHLLLRTLEQIHADLPANPPFQEASAGVRVTIDAPPGEVLQTPEAMEYARSVIACAERDWPALLSVFLLPRNTLTGLDDLQLLLEVDPAQLPSAEQIRQILRIPLPRQRVALYLLLDNGAYLLHRDNRLEFWHVLLSPAASPEVFSLLSEPAFVLRGAPRAATRPRWTAFAATVFNDELNLRRSALAKAPAASQGDPLHLLRNIWRQLQLEVIDRSARAGAPVIPLTVPAVRRGIDAWGLPDTSLFHQLQTAYESELAGQPSGAAKLIPQLFALFSKSSATQVS